MPRQPAATKALPTQIAYYRDPDGKAVYSATPRKTVDGRDFVAVDAASDVRFAAAGTIKADAEPHRGGAGHDPQDQVLPQSHGPSRHLAGA